MSDIPLIEQDSRLIAFIVVHPANAVHIIHIPSKSTDSCFLGGLDANSSLGFSRLTGCQVFDGGDSVCLKRFGK